MSDAWPPAAEPRPSSSNTGRTIAIVVGILAIVALVVVAVVVLAGDDGSSDDRDRDDLLADVEGAGEHVATRGRSSDTDEPDEPDETTTTAPEETTTTEPDDNCPTTGEPVDRDSLPAPDTSATPQELGIERAGRNTEWPIDLDETWPYIGELFVPIMPGEYNDVPIHLDAGEYAVVFAANDCIKGSVEIYAPSGELIAEATDLGSPGTVEGWEFTNFSNDALTESGTYVFRVIQDTGTTDGGFPIRFYGPGAS